ncbi:MAG: MgtC/SapB family protein [Patescibacteria group bacterium]
METDLIKIILAIILGAAIGIERGRSNKPAGMRTYMLITLASTIFTIISLKGINIFNSSQYDPGRIMSNVLIGIGFIGAGVIIFNNNKLQGVTTAASIWVSTAIGMMIGLEMYSLAIIVTIISFFIIAFLFQPEEKLEKIMNKRIKNKE